MTLLNNLLLNVLGSTPSASEQVVRQTSLVSSVTGRQSLEVVLYRVWRRAGLVFHCRVKEARSKRPPTGVD